MNAELANLAKEIGRIAQSQHPPVEKAVCQDDAPD